jgi:hypothetical protein
VHNDFFLAVLQNAHSDELPPKSDHSQHAHDARRMRVRSMALLRFLLRSLCSSRLSLAVLLSCLSPLLFSFFFSRPEKKKESKSDSKNKDSKDRKTKEKDKSNTTSTGAAASATATTAASASASSSTLPSDPLVSKKHRSKADSTAPDSTETKNAGGSAKKDSSVSRSTGTRKATTSRKKTTHASNNVAEEEEKAKRKAKHAADDGQTQRARSTARPTR